MGITTGARRGPRELVFTHLDLRTEGASTGWVPAWSEAPPPDLLEKMQQSHPKVTSVICVIGADDGLVAGHAGTNGPEAFYFELEAADQYVLIPSKESVILAWPCGLLVQVRGREIESALSQFVVDPDAPV